MKFKFKFIYVTILALFIEILIFNFHYVSGTLNKNVEKNIVFTLNDMEKINWKESNNKLVSEEDPMLIIPDINTFVKDVEISLTTDKKVPFIMCYYTQNKEDIFNDNMSIALVDNLSDKNYIKVNSYVKDIRLDLGDNAGLNLNNLSITINPTVLNFSMARVITIILIYLISKGLFYLQKSHSFEEILYDERGDKLE